MVWMLEGMNDSSHSAHSTDGEKSAVLDSALSQGSIENHLISLQTEVRRLQEENARLHDELRKERISHIKNKNTTRKLKALEKSYTALSRRATQAKETVDKTAQTTQVAQEQRKLFRTMRSRLEEVTSSSFKAFKSDVQSENEAQARKESDDGLLEPFGRKPGRSSVRSFLSEVRIDLENECETKDPPQSTGLFGTLSRILPGMPSEVASDTIKEPEE
eukprot:scaffold31138_cov58-Attheya_sp.AAC.2